MSADTFCEIRRVPKSTQTREVFNDLRSIARLEHGISGHSGTIAEKSEFSMVKSPPEGDADIKSFIARVPFSPKLSDKNAAAYCIRHSVSETEDEVIFFGMAPS